MKKKSTAEVGRRWRRQSRSMRGAGVGKEAYFQTNNSQLSISVRRAPRADLNCKWIRQAGTRCLGEKKIHARRTALPWATEVCAVCHQVQPPWPCAANRKPDARLESFVWPASDCAIKPVSCLPLIQYWWEERRYNVHLETLRANGLPLSTAGSSRIVSRARP